jgi:hypothetical protein
VVVDLAQMQRLPQLRATDDAQSLEAYVAWARGKREAHIRWLSPDRAELRADTGANEAVLIKVNHDAGWVSSQGAIGQDPIGFLLVKGASSGPVTLRFGASWSAWLGRAITAATILLLLFSLPLKSLVGRASTPAAGLQTHSLQLVTAAVALLPAIFAYGIFQLRTPPTVAVAEQAYRRLQPPLINPGAIVDGVTLAQPPLARGSLITIFGANFGAQSDSVRVQVGERRAEILYRGPNQVNLRLPVDAPTPVDVSVEVNGCHGNSFAVATTTAAPPSK